MKKFALGLALLLGGCGEEKEWTAEQDKHCNVLGGSGYYVSSTKLYECYGSAKPFTFKFEFNKEVAYRQPERVKLFEARYIQK